MNQEAEALRQAVAAVSEATRRVCDLQRFDIDDSNGERLELTRMIEELQAVHSELDDALYGLEDEDEDDGVGWKDDDEEEWDDDE